MRTEDQTSIHLLLATIVTVFGVFLIVITLALSWELWMIPVILVGNTLVWCMHIGRFGSESFYKNLCAGLLMVGFFFFGVHPRSLYDIPAVACMVILIFSMFDKKRLLYMTAALYVVELLYHFLILKTITREMEPHDMIRLGIDVSVTLGALAIARYRIKRRLVDRKRFNDAFTELEKAGRQNAVFLSNVSHELRTPINMVLGISEVVLEKGIYGELKEEMQSIQLAGKRLSSQINNMLDYTEIVEGTLTSLKQEYMLTSVLNDVITLTAMQGNRNQLEMVFDMDPKIPAVLIGDAEKISHVLKILLENSIKFTEKGGIHVCMECRKESYGVNLVIDVYDTGIGMTEEQLNQMFDDFYQADSGSSRFAGGLGLGLPIARGLLESMGGFIHFASKENQGLEAHIVIPQGVADDSPAIVVSEPQKLCIACYFRPDKYSCDEVKGYYDRMILHLVDGLGLEGYQAHNFDGLLKLLNNHPVTHVFIAEAEYQENGEYYEELARSVWVVVIAERDFILRRDSGLLIIHKPFSALSVANLLNGDLEENGVVGTQGNKPFTCVGVKALAVDDEEMNLVVAKGVLGSYGIEVDTCLSGKEAVERLGSEDYDMIFLDHMMPGFDGVETLRRIREINNGMYQELPVVALTANTISGAREMFRQEGFTEFIPKPIERSTLERVLRKVLPEEAIQYGGETQLEIHPKAKPEPEPVVLWHRREPVQKEAVNKEPARKEAEKKELAQKEAVNKEPTQKEAVKNEPAQEQRVHREPKRKEPAREKSERKEPEREALVRKKSEHQEPVHEKSETEEPASEGNSLLQLKPLVEAGMNVRLGLEYCCGEKEFYLEMLQTFAEQSQAKKTELQSLYDSGSWGDYAIKVHALKSTSLTIGAEELSEKARVLEQAGRNGDTEYIRNHHLELLQIYDKVCRSIVELE